MVELLSLLSLNFDFGGCFHFCVICGFKYLSNLLLLLHNNERRPSNFKPVHTFMTSIQKRCEYYTFPHHLQTSNNAEMQDDFPMYGTPALFTPKYLRSCVRGGVDKRIYLLASSDAMGRQGTHVRPVPGT